MFSSNQQRHILKVFFSFCTTSSCQQLQLNKQSLAILLPVYSVYFLFKSFYVSLKKQGAKLTVVKVLLQLKTGKALQSTQTGLLQEMLYIFSFKNHHFDPYICFCLRNNRTVLYCLLAFDYVECTMRVPVEELLLQKQYQDKRMHRNL